MFTITISSKVAGGFNNNGRKCILAGCPKSGLEAIDFRRAAGVTEEPTNIVLLPEFSVDSEEWARKLPLDDNANCHFVDIHGYSGFCQASPAAVRAYERDQTAQTAAELILDVLALRESYNRAKQAEADRQTAETARAFEICKPKIDELERKVTYWKQTAENLQKRFDEIEEETEQLNAN